MSSKRPWVALAIVLGGFAVQADESIGDRPSAAEPIAAARLHYERGLARFRLGEYESAVAEFQAGYQLTPQPLFLYNIAQCHRWAGNAEQAITFYRRFLAAAPRAPQRTKVEGYIAMLEAEEPAQARSAHGENESHASVASAKSRHDLAEVSFPEPPPGPREQPSPLPAIAVGSLAVITGGIGLGLFLGADSIYGDLAGKCAPIRCSSAGPERSQADTGNALAIASYATWTAAAVMAIVDIGLWIYRARRSSTRADVAFSPAPGGLAVGGRF